MAMPLSDYERQVLDQIESDLAAEDGARRSGHRRFAFIGLTVLLAAAAAVGVVLLGAVVLPGAVGTASAFVVGAALGAALPTFCRRHLRRSVPERGHAHE
jgi:uncharacterized membrane protein YdbT with pleckstrin-like domain